MLALLAYLKSVWACVAVCPLDFLFTFGEQVGPDVFLGASKLKG